MKQDIYGFLDTLWQYYDAHARVLPWRIPDSNGYFDPYKILVSEMMLQQTQVERVIPKYLLFLERFPSIDVLQSSQLADVFALWSGLGYNRRAKYLHDMSHQLHTAKQPWLFDDLISLKGIGKNTAAAICAYSYNQPHIFIETNIRTVYLHHFFPTKDKVSDGEILQLVEKTIDRARSRDFYWALMDYGTYLKRQGIRNGNQSLHYKKQSTFEGSKRQIRGAVMRLLSERGETSTEALQQTIRDTRLEHVLEDLEREHMIVRSSAGIRIT